MKKQSLRVALVHDYLREYGGAERVVEALHELYPEAPLYTAFFDRESLGIHAKRFEGWDIRESWITKIPLYKKLYSPLRVFSPQFFEQFDLSGFDVVISSSNMYFAKAVKVSEGATHISYCHTPARSLYGYSTMTDWKKNWLIRVGGTILNHYLRIVDFYIAQRVGVFVANSKEVQKRIQKYFKRDSVVVYPPVIIPKQFSKKQSGQYYVYVGRLALSKHVDLAILACTQLGVPLKIVGTGKGQEFLQELAGQTVEFLGGVDDAQLASVYAEAKAVIYPAEDEDFGIVPVEAMGHGVPVIVHNSGGPKETVIEGKTGILFDDLSVESVVAAIKKCEKTQWNAQKIYTHAQQFSKERFMKEMSALVKATSSKA